MLPESSGGRRFRSLPNGFTPHITVGDHFVDHCDGDSDQPDLSLPYYTSISDTTGEEMLMLRIRVPSDFLVNWFKQTFFL